MGQAQRAYIPAAGHSWSLPLYDPFVKLIGGDSARKALVDQADIRPGQRILDIGCGTGTLAVLIKQLHPEVEVFGLDPDPKALARGRRKAEQAAVSVQFDEGYSDRLPYVEGSFDRVFSSFMFHHLQLADREKTVQEVRRVLKPGGSVHVLDFGGSKTDSGGIIAHLFHSKHTLKDNFEGRLLTLLKQAGFANSEEVANRRMLLGQVAYYRANLG